MTQAEMITQLSKLTLIERLELVEIAVQQIRVELDSRDVACQTSEPTDEEIQRAVDIMLPEYLHDRELTALTALDGEDFYVEE